jgi:hypothetical protein
MRRSVVREALLTYGQFIRLAVFCGVFALMAIWELIDPRRIQSIGRGWRWPNNLGLVALDAALVRILLPTTTVAVALVAEAHGLGLFNVVSLLCQPRRAVTKAPVTKSSGRPPIGEKAMTGAERMRKLRATRRALAHMRTV